MPPVRYDTAHPDTERKDDTMSENTNLVKTWAENIKADAETAVKELTGKDFDYGSRQKVLASVCEIKGACEAIIAAVSNPKNQVQEAGCPQKQEDDPCSDCKFNSPFGWSTACLSCKFGGGIADMRETK